MPLASACIEPECHDRTTVPFDMPATGEHLSSKAGDAGSHGILPLWAADVKDVGGHARKHVLEWQPRSSKGTVGCNTPHHR